jgi:hypothetical protein
VLATIPWTTRGCSVNRSSRPKKSPYREFSPTKVVLPRLWYRVTSFSQAGTFTGASGGLKGVYGKLTSGSSGGKLPVPA